MTDTMTKEIDAFVRDSILAARAISLENGDMEAVKEMDELLEGLNL